jgi:hypothetical protein
MDAYKGYAVVTAEDERFGEVVGLEGDNLVVEHGRVFKHRHPLPLAFAHVDEAEHLVRTTLSKHMIEEAPELKGDGDVDEQEIAAYYGLAKGYDSPPTEGDGVLDPDDPAMSADQLSRRLGLVPAEEERARIRSGAEDIYGPAGRQIHPPDPHITGEPRKNTNTT